MVVGVFPAAKLGALILKQISKPIANIVKENAKKSPVFRKYVCMPPAHFYNWCEIKLKMWIMNLGKPANIPKLNEAMAIELGANLLGEGVIFIIAAGILISEYNRGVRKEAAKEEAKRLEISEIQNALKELYLRTEEHAAHLREISRQLGDLDTRIGNKEKHHKPSPPVDQGKALPTPNTSSGDLPPKDSLTQNTIQHFDPSLYGKNNSLGQASLIFKAVNDIEEQFWDYPLVERENSLLMLGLFYVNKLLRL